MKPQRPLPWLLGFLRPFAGQVALSILLGVATIGSSIALLGTSGYLIASAALQPSIAVLEVSIVGVRFFGISRAVFRYGERLVSHSVNFRLLAKLRVWFYRKIEPLAPARLQDYHSADLLSRAIADIDTLENFYVRAVAPPLVALCVTCGVSWFAGRYDPRLGLLLGDGLLLGGIALPLVTFMLAREPGRVAVERRAELNTVLLDTIQGMPDLLTFGQAEAQKARITKVGRSLGAAQARMARAGALGNALGSLLSGLTLLGVLLVAIPLVGSQIDGISLTVLALITLASFEAVTPLNQAAQQLESCLQAARRLIAMVTLPPVIRPVEHPIALPTGPLDVCIRDLWFSYADDRDPALEDFNLSLPYGKHLALIGPSGAGKTTLFNLLMRFWEFDRGTIELNRRDLHCYDAEDVRRQMSVISQSTYLFAGTLRENLLLARPQATQMDLDRAIEQSQLTEVVAKLPQGLDTWVGEWGVRLSGGERQRLAVARALLRDAPLLLLDEPTANLDAVTERALLAMLWQASAGRSMIYISHRLVGLAEMDEILVLQQGRVVERGTQNELLAQNGLFARMTQIQSQSLA